MVKIKIHGIWIVIDNMLYKKKKCVIIIISLNILFDIIAGSTKYTRTVQGVCLSHEMVKNK